MPANQEDQNEIDFRQYLRVLKRHWLVTAGVTGSVLGLTALFTFSQKPVYESQGKLLIKQNGASSLTGLSEKVGALSGLTTTSSPLETEAEVIRSNPIVDKTIDALDLKDKKGKRLKVEDFLKLFKVKSVKGTDVLEITYRDTNPKLAADVINNLINNYIENNIKANRLDATSAREFLTKQLPAIEQRVVAAEAGLRRFKDENKVVSLPDEAKVGVEALSGLSSEITKAQALLSDVSSRSISLQKELELTTQQAVELSNLNQSTGVQQVLAEYQKAQDELAVAQTRFTEEHPKVKDLAAKGQALREQLEKRVGKIVDTKQPVSEKNLQIGQLKQTLTLDLVKSEVDRLAVNNQVQVLQAAYLNYQGRLKVIPRLEQQQRALERRLQVGQSTYQQVLKQLQEVEVVEQQKVGNARIVSPAEVPEKPISPKVPLNLALGGFLGILLGVGSALALEAMDKSLKTIEDAKRLLGYPVLGKIPQIGAKGKGNVEDLPVLNDPYSPATSNFEMLVTNLGFTLSDQPLRVIAVTSSMPGEGKSFVAANLAVAKVQMGYRVLLIDADMRRPRQHKIWEQPNFMGLSEVLVGQGDFVGIVQEAIHNLDILSAGTIPPNPAALLDSQRMRVLLEQASKDYDFVIVDTPPLTAVTDALLVSKMVDGILLVVRPGVVEKDAVAATQMQLEQSGQRVLGMVMNDVNTNTGGYYHSKGYYGVKPAPKEKESETMVPPLRIG
jgi:polysaccharide biosynthesis transport protein